MIKFDNTLSNIVVNIADKNKISLEDTSKIITSAFSNVRYIIENKEGGVIKLDYLGKFIYSSRYKEKLQNPTTYERKN